MECSKFFKNFYLNTEQNTLKAMSVARTQDLRVMGRGFQMLLLFLSSSHAHLLMYVMATFSDVGVFEINQKNVDVHTNLMDVVLAIKAHRWHVPYVTGVRTIVTFAYRNPMRVVETPPSPSFGHV